MIRLSALAALSLGMLLAWQTSAPAAIKEGAKEVSAFAALSTTDPEVGDSTTQLILQFAGGVFLDPQKQVGGSFTQISVESEGFDATIRVIAGFFKFHVNPEQDVVPYVGAQAGMTFIEAGPFSDSAFSYGGMAGAKFFVSEDLSYNAELNLLMTTIDDQDYTQTTLQVGMSYYF
jgi:hypothetical protein